MIFEKKARKIFNENIWNWNFLFKLSPSDHLWCTWQSGRLPEGFAYEKCSLWAGVVFFPSDHNNRMLQIGSGWVQLTPDNSNPRLLEPPANSDQNRFSLDFLHTFNVILPSVTRTSRKLEIIFCFPSDHFYINLPSITRTMFWALKKVRKKQGTFVRNVEFEFPFQCCRHIVY